MFDSLREPIHMLALPGAACSCDLHSQADSQAPSLTVQLPTDLDIVCSSSVFASFEDGPAQCLVRR